MEKKAIGSYIAELRISNGMTQFELADRLNVPFETVSEWERGERYPEITLIPEIADVFGVTSDEILRSRVITEIDASETKELETDAPELHSAPGISIDDRLNTAMAKYKINNVISMGLAALGVVLMLAAAYLLQMKEAGFGVCIIFAAAAVFAEVINIIRTRSVLSASALEGLTPPASVYEAFFKPVPYVLCTAAAAVLLALPAVIDFELTFPDGTVMTDFVYYLESARHMALLSAVLLTIAIFVTDLALGRTSRYGDINVFPRSGVKPIIWLLAVLILIVI